MSGVDYTDAATANPRMGWIFSPALDFSLFCAPILLVFLVSPGIALVDSRAIGWSYITFVDEFFNEGHLFGTFGPVLRRRAEGRIGFPSFAFGPFAVIALSILLYLAGREIFFSVFSVIGLFHVMAQQYGWVMLSRKRAQEAFGRILDSAAIWNVMLGPVIWWLSPLSKIKKSYFPTHAFPLLFPASIARAAICIQWTVILLWICNLFVQHRKGLGVNWPKVLLVFSTWLWFYLGMVIAPDRFIFFTGMVFLHPLPYFLYARSDTATPTLRTHFDDPSKMAGLLGKPLLFVGFCVGMVMLFQKLSPYFMNSRSPLELVIWLPSILHYYFDSFIWRRSQWAHAN